MYQPPHFKIEDVKEQESFIHSHPFGALISNSESGLFATHLPLYFEGGIFYGHIARANLHKNLSGEAMLILQGQQGYISPNFYATKQETHKVVPTWNYEIMHIYGDLVFDDSNEFKRQVITRLTEKFEVQRDKPWAVSDAPKEFIEAQLKGIIGLTLTPKRFEFKSKMSQNRNDADKQGVIKGLSKENSLLAENVKRRLPPA